MKRGIWIGVGAGCLLVGGAYWFMHRHPGPGDEFLGKCETLRDEIVESRSFRLNASDAALMERLYGLDAGAITDSEESKRIGLLQVGIAADLPHLPDQGDEWIQKLSASRTPAVAAEGLRAAEFWVEERGDGAGRYLDLARRHLKDADKGVREQAAELETVCLRARRR